MDLKSPKKNIVYLGRNFHLPWHTFSLLAKGDCKDLQESPRKTLDFSSRLKNQLDSVDGIGLCRKGKDIVCKHTQKQDNRGWTATCRKVAFKNRCSSKGNPYIWFFLLLFRSLFLSLSFAIVLGAFRVVWNWIFSSPVLTILCNKWSTNVEKLFVSVSVIALWRIYLVTNIVSLFDYSINSDLFYEVKKLFFVLLSFNYLWFLDSLFSRTEWLRNWIF